MPPNQGGSRRKVRKAIPNTWTDPDHTSKALTRPGEAACLASVLLSGYALDRCRANVEHKRPLRPNDCPDFQAKFLKPFQLFLLCVEALPLSH